MIRFGEHERDVRNAIGKKEKPKTALAKHCVDKAHTFDFDNFKILCRERNKIRLRRQEVNHIIQHQDIACNYKTDTKDSCNAYYTLIKRKKKKKEQQNIPPQFSLTVPVSMTDRNTNNDSQIVAQ